jgi:PadR family transcriptional regulator PadR
MHGRGRGHRRRGGGIPRRPVRFLEPALLLLLWDNPAHGYTLLDQLGAFGLAGIDPSVVYRALRDMEERGWVVSVWNEEQTQGPPRRVYRLTAEGRKVLDWWAQDLQETRGIIDGFLERYGRSVNQREDNARTKGGE